MGERIHEDGDASNGSGNVKVRCLSNLITAKRNHVLLSFAYIVKSRFRPGPKEI